MQSLRRFNLTCDIFLEIAALNVEIENYVAFLRAVNSGAACKFMYCGPHMYFCHRVEENDANYVWVYESQTAPRASRVSGKSMNP